MRIRRFSQQLTSNICIKKRYEEKEIIHNINSKKKREREIKCEIKIIHVQNGQNAQHPQT